MAGSGPLLRLAHRLRPARQRGPLLVERRHISTGFTADLAGNLPVRGGGDRSGRFRFVARRHLGGRRQLRRGAARARHPGLQPGQLRRRRSAGALVGVDRQQPRLLRRAHQAVPLAVGAALSGPAGSSATLAANDVTPFFVPDVPGAYQVSAQVTDALGNVSPAKFATFNTSPCGNNPVNVSISGPALVSSTTNAQLSFTGTVSDLDNTSCPGAVRGGAVPAVDGADRAGRGHRLALVRQPPPRPSSAGTAPATTCSPSPDRPATASPAGATVSIVLNDCGATPPQILSVTSNAANPAPGSHVCADRQLDRSRYRPGRFLRREPAGAAADLHLAPGLAAGQRQRHHQRADDPRPSASTPPRPAPTLFDVTRHRQHRPFLSAPFRVAVSTGGCQPVITSINVPSPTPAAGASQTLSATLGTDTCVSGPPGFSYFWSVSARPLRSSATLRQPHLAHPGVRRRRARHLPDPAGGHRCGRVLGHRQHHPDRRELRHAAERHPEHAAGVRAQRH